MLAWEVAGTNLAQSRSPHDEKENFAVLRKVGSYSLTDEDGLVWEWDGQWPRPRIRRAEISIIQVQGRE